MNAPPPTAVTSALVRLSLGLRAGLGAAAYLAPRTTGRSMGLHPGPDAALPYLARVFGVRDVALAVLTAGATGPARRRLLIACAGIDVADIASALLARRGGLDRVATVNLVAVALAALLPEVLELRAGSRADGGDGPRPRAARGP